MNESLPHVNADVVYQQVGEDLVLVHLKTNQIFALNPTGGRFWELLTDGLDRPAIEEALLEEFEVTPGQLEREIDQLLAALAREGLVRAA